VIAAVADRAPERIHQVAYLDAFVPADGQSLLDMIPADRRPAMEQLVEREGDGWLLPRFAAGAKSTPGWSYRELSTSHVPYITHPDQVTAVLLEPAG
jgi:hypothetical protein